MGTQSIINFIKENWKILALTAGLFLVLWLKSTIKPIIVDTNDINKPQPTTVIKDKNGESYYQYKEEEVPEGVLEKKYDSVLKLLKIKPKQVTVTITQVDTIYKHITTKITDTSVTLSKENKDISITAFADLKDSTNSYISFHLTPDTLTRTTGVRKHLFKKDEILVFDHHTNSLFKTTEGASSIIKVDKPILILSPYIGYDIINRKIGAGIAISTPRLSIRIK